MARNVVKISALVEKQLPEFIASEYPKFSAFLQKYYEQLELEGQPLNIIGNITKYQDIDYYEREILQEFTSLVSISEILDVNDEIVDYHITVENGDSFPIENGYITIDDEIIFYKQKTDNVFSGCFRNVSGTTTLGDLYSESVYKQVSLSELNVAQDHLVGAEVRNISNLFLYAFVKNFESQYLASFPEESLKPEVDKRQLIKNIKSFYQSKGTEQSIKFIFNSIVSESVTDVPTVYYPKDNTLKSSTSGWINKYALKVKVISGDIRRIIGEKIEQKPDEFVSNAQSAFAVVDNVRFLGNYDGESIYEIILAPESVVGKFEVAKKTFLTKNLSSSDSNGSKINVFSTIPWKGTQGKIIIGNEEILYDGKTVNQFTILNRTGNGFYSVNTPVYDYKTLVSEYYDNQIKYTVNILPLGVLYNLNVRSNSPYSSEGDDIQINSPGFDTTSPIIYNTQGNLRWKLNDLLTSPASAHLDGVLSNVAAIYEDESYYYIASSSFPNYFTDFPNLIPSEQKHLKLIRKNPTLTTEIYPITPRDVGIFVNGSVAYSYKDYDDNDIVYGGVEEFIVTSGGSSYKNPPYVLISGDRGAKAKAILSGEVVERIEIISKGKGYESDPKITITSGRGAKVQAIVTKDRVTSLVIENPGEYYSTPPIIRIIDEKNTGRLAEYTSIISSDGKLIGFNKISEGKFYSQGSVRVEVDAVGYGASATAYIKRWKRNRFEKLNSQNLLDSNYGYLFENIDPSLGLGYAHLAAPLALLQELGDDGSTHSPIIGYAYDGNPIYGPYGYSDSLNSSSPITRMSSSYRIDPPTENRPELQAGFLIEDYKYQHRFGTLDENNGRFCVTPEYPEGTYAYFITVDSSNNPVFPYILGEKFYNIPVDSNYAKKISQKDLPLKVKRLRTSNIPNNGVNTLVSVETINSGGVSGCLVEDSSDNFSVGCSVFINNKQTEGQDCVAEVNSVNGEEVVSIESKQTKALLLNTVNNVYLFDKSILTQDNSGATGEVVGNVFETKKLVLRNVVGNFNEFDELNASVRVILLLVDREVFYSKGSILRLTNGKQVTVNRIENDRLLVSSNPFNEGDIISFPQSSNGVVANTLYYVIEAERTSFKISTVFNGPAVSLESTSSFGVVANSEIARGEILEDVLGTNTVKLKVLAGNYTVGTTDYLRSSNIDDTLGARIFRRDNLSQNIQIESVDSNIAIVNTVDNHNITENDKVFVDINPNDFLTTTDYYVRKRIYQKVKLQEPSFVASIVDTGIGSIKILNSGEDYANSGSNVYSNVELIFADQTLTRDGLGEENNFKNAKATITVQNGKVTNVAITSKGTEYRIGDILTVVNTDLQRVSGSLSQSLLYLEVSHVGLGSLQTNLYLNTTEGISPTDYLKINDEIVRVLSIDEDKVVIERPFFSTNRQNHFNGAAVSLYRPRYNFIENQRLGNSTGDPFVKSYDPLTQELVVYFDLNQTIESINDITFSSSLRDSASPSKLVRVDSIIEDASYRFEFSEDQISWLMNPVIDIQISYNYKFITSHPSLSGSFLEFSPSSNYNVFVSETKRGSTPPGTGDSSTSYITVKFGYGSVISSNTYTNKKDLGFTKIFYFDKSGIINNNLSYLQLVDDPLQGENTVIYVSPKSFVYRMDRVPQYDGSGSISYTTNSKFAIGSISTISITNPGFNYKKLPTVYGVSPSIANESVADVIYDEISKKVLSVEVLIPGKNYSKPIAVLVYQGKVYTPNYRIVLGNSNEIVAVINEDRDLVFSTKPKIYIAESDVTAYFESKNIGTIKNINIFQNGSNYYDDYSILPYFNSHTILTISNFGDDYFISGETIEQYENNRLIASATVSPNGFRNNSNILKIYKINGEFKKNLPIIGTYKKNTCLVKSVSKTEIDAIVESYYDNLGYYDTDSGKLSSGDQKLADSYFYQDYSYVIKSKTTIDKWRKLIKQTVHPAGFNLFGEVLIESEVGNKMPKPERVTSSVTTVELWDEKTNRITIESTKRQVSQNILTVKNSNINKGHGSVFASEYDTSETLSFVFLLDAPFDGDFDESGNRSGRRTFTMIVPRILPDGTRINAPLNVSNINNLIITLDGIIQEPGVAYTVNNSQITFSEAPLGERISQNQIVAPQKFIGRFVRFKANSLNQQYFRKIQNIDHLFDSKENRFTLYYENGDPVSLGPKENLLVTLDGVLQENKMTPLIPATSAYYINRNVIPNEIVFVNPPVSQGSLGYQNFFAYSVGNYERLKINTSLIDNNNGPFLITSVLGDRVVNIDNDRNVLVFVDGILQVRNRSYTITGPFIRFSDPLTLGKNVNILYLFGREIDKTLTFFNFEENNFFNVVHIQIDNITYNESAQQITKLLSKYTTVYQGNDFLTRTCIGEIMSMKALPSENYSGKLQIGLSLRTQNQKFSEDYDLKFTDNTGIGVYYTVSSLNIESITAFEEIDDTTEIVRKVKTAWLYKTSLPTDAFNFIDIGDSIKVDGEKDFRKVLTIPNLMTKIGHREEDVIQTNHAGVVGVSSYNGLIEGVGLTVTARLTGDRVTSLIWNKREFNLIENDKESPSTAFGYSSTPKLIFVPQPQLDTFGNIVGPVVGGGAEGYVVMDRGNIIDVVLTKPGSGYKSPPKVYVTREFDIIKSDEEVVRKSTVLNLAIEFLLDSTISRVITVIKPPSLLPEIQTISDVRSFYDSSNPTVIVLPEPKILRINDSLNTKIISELHLAAPEILSISTVETRTDTFVELSLSVRSSDYVNRLTVLSSSFGFADNVDLGVDRYYYDQLGNCFALYEDFKYMDIGVAALSEQNTLELFEIYYPALTIGDFADRSKSNTTKENNFWNAYASSIQDHGTVLDSAISASDNIIYVADTSRFPESGQLVLGGSSYIDGIEVVPASSTPEIVYYSSKMSDRFLGVSRGENLTNAQDHAAGTYLRTVSEEYRFNLEIGIGTSIINYPTYYYTNSNQFIQLEDNLFLPREGEPFELL